jgi:hypothetical protein
MSFRQFLSVALCLLLVARCANATSFVAVLRGSNEFPDPRASPAVGLGLFTFDNKTKYFQWTLFHNASGPTIAHIHGPAGPQQTANVLFNFSTTGVSPMRGFRKLSVCEEAILHAGLWYVNVHTTTYPVGEIRGQILAPSNTYAALLTGANESPPVLTNASGVAIVQTNEEAQTISWVVLHDVQNATEAHLHSSAANGQIVTGIDEEGSVVSPLERTNVSVSALPLWSFNDLKTGQYYIRVHSTAFPTGEIRGDLRPLEITSGAPPPEGSDGDGGSGGGSGDGSGDGGSGTGPFRPGSVGKTMDDA